MPTVAAEAVEEPEATPPGFEDMDFGAGAAEAPPANPRPLASKSPARGAAPTASLARGGKAPAKEDSWKWWQYVAGGVFIAGLGVFEFIRLGQLESGEVESVRVAHWEAFIYNLLGRAGLLIVALLLALFTVGVGIYQFLQRRNAQL